MTSFQQCCFPPIPALSPVILFFSYIFPVIFIITANLVCVRSSLVCVQTAKNMHNKLDFFLHLIRTTYIYMYASKILNVVVQNSPLQQVCMTNLNMLWNMHKGIFHPTFSKKCYRLDFAHGNLQNNIYGIWNIFLYIHITDIIYIYIYIK